MTSSNNYTPLANSGNFYLIDSQQPAGVYLANMLADGSMDLLDRVEYVEDLQTKVETLTAAHATDIEKLRAELESLRTIPMPVVEKTKTRSKTDKSAANRELAAALRACNKGSVNGVWPEWSRAQQFIKNGLSVEEAAGKA